MDTHIVSVLAIVNISNVDVNMWVHISLGISVVYFLNKYPEVELLDQRVLIRVLIF